MPTCRGPADQDREILLDLDQAGHQHRAIRDLSPGLWRVRVRWSVDGDEAAVDMHRSAF